MMAAVKRNLFILCNYIDYNPVYELGEMALSSSLTLSLTDRESMKLLMVFWLTPSPVRVSALSVSYGLG